MARNEFHPQGRSQPGSRTVGLLESSNCRQVCSILPLTSRAGSAPLLQICVLRSGWLHRRTSPSHNTHKHHSLLLHHMQMLSLTKHRKKCESIWGPKKQSFGPLIFRFHHRCPNFTDLAEKTIQNLLLKVYFAYGSCKNTLLVQFFQHLGAPRPKIWTLGHQKTPPVHWLWSLREALPD